MAAETSNPLADWPEDRRVGLLVLASDPSASLAEVDSMLRSSAAGLRWWSAKSKLMAVGPSVVPPFGSVHLVELENAASAMKLVGAIENGELGAATVLAATLVSPKSERRLRRLQSFLRRLPRPSMTGGPLPPSYRVSLVPSDDQLSALATISEDEPVLTLSLNRYKERAVDPLTGEEKSGRDVFQTYFRRSLTTFSRVGAKVLWRGRFRGVVTGELDMPRWHEAWAVSYPSYAAFNRMLGNAGLRAKIGHRIAGLESSWIVMSEIVDSSGPSSSKRA